jgi:hypothetical protein
MWLTTLLIMFIDTMILRLTFRRKLGHDFYPYILTTLWEHGNKHKIEKIVVCHHSETHGTNQPNNP